MTGGAGFIGTNLADRLLREGRKVIIYDNLSRPGVRHNLEWLKQQHGNQFLFRQGDVRDRESLQEAVSRASHVYHFAAQVAVTTSLNDPIDDFEINARGTLNLLEAARAQTEPPSILLTSTNKVYGDLRDVALTISKGRYQPADRTARAHGFNENRPLAFHSPYGCSKGAACQYVLDYSRTFGLRTTVFRMSCIYGLHQFGNEDQGWVAHFLIQALNHAPITIYGDGRQVRDILFVEDLVDALSLARDNISSISGQAFNIGGGPRQTISLLELLDLIEELHGASPHVRFDGWRAADQQYYVSDIRKFKAATGWEPKVPVQEGVARLYHWLKDFREHHPEPLLEIHGANGAARNGHARPGALRRQRGNLMPRTPRLNHLPALRRAAGKGRQGKLAAA
ncbi:MAG TPA: SDR family NAD(P)-dependent oxidoreductase [Verrucomicrobiae bacterium]|nr:SDR family NAD(P)-dependent oxidoreductase [Verrucomicrobiae bacterium]